MSFRPGRLRGWVRGLFGRRARPAFAPSPAHPLELILAEPVETAEDIEARALALLAEIRAARGALPKRARAGWRAADSVAAAGAVFHPVPDRIIDIAVRLRAYRDLCALLGMEPNPGHEALRRASRSALPLDDRQQKFLHDCFRRILADRYRWRYDVMRGRRFSLGNTARHDAYRIVNLDPGDGGIGALALSRIERFGNFIIQLINAFAVAEQLGVRRIILPAEHAFITPLASAPIMVSAAPATIANTLTGAFFRRVALLRGYSRDDAEGVLARHVRPLLQPVFAAIAFDPVDLTVHIRAGDVFGADPVHSSYGQPPLAFYTKAIALCDARSIRIVFENRDNPVVDALIAWCARRGVIAHVQSAALIEDIAALYSSRRLAISRGTFCWAIADLSPHIREIFVFADGAPNGTAPGIRITRLIDGDGAYRAALMDRNWANTAAQREMMLTYPEEAIISG